jgi:hypothetical protein
MTTIAASPLTDALQTLVDARLDTIDRMLLGRVNRQDRLAIVREVESQIFDLLPRHDGPIDRDDVLAVLARLDPPEAYLSDEDSPAEARAGRILTTPRAYSRPDEAQPARFELASGILGIVSILVITFAWLVVITEIGDETAAELMFLGAVGLTFVTSILAIVFAAKVRLRGAWSLVGLVTGVLCLLASIGSGIWFLGNL